MKNFDKLYINGTWVASSGSKTIDVINATTEEVMGRIPEGTDVDANAAVAAARAAFGAWSQTPAAKRGAYLGKIQEGIKARMSEIAATITGEVGVPIKLANLLMVGLPLGTFGNYAKMAAEFQFEETVGNSVIVREPVGVVACITPWNYPLHQIALKVGAALAAGCTVVVKPSEVAPLNAFMLAEIIDAAGLPKGVFNLVSGTGPVVGEALARHPDVDMVSFTGSTRAGKRVTELAAQSVKRVALELGGKSAAVILDDADFNQAVKATVSNCYLNSGQTCAATTRMLVPESRYAEAAQIAAQVAAGFAVGDPMADGTKLGPLISQLQQKRVRDYINKGVAEGAELLTGGAEQPVNLPKGYFVKPTVFGKVTNQMTIAREEIFGPVLSIITYKDEADAVAIANDTPYGLAGTVWGSPERATRVARQVRAGQVDVNGGPFNAAAPFGGFKQSGRGREGGKYGLEEFLEYKAMQFRPAKAA